jgi:hypothetical protein
MANHDTAAALTMEAVMVPGTFTLAWWHMRGYFNGRYERWSLEDQERRRTCAPRSKDTRNAVSPRR